MNAQSDEAQVNQMVEEMKKGLNLSPQQIAFLMGMAYDPEMHEGELEPKHRKATKEDVEQILKGSRK